MEGKKKGFGKKLWIIVAVVAILLLISWKAGWLGKDNSLIVELDTVQSRSLLAKVSESGVIQPEVEVPVAPDVSGEVISLYVKEGDFVKRGQLLFAIRPDDFKSAVEQMNANLNSAKADYAQGLSALNEARNSLKQDSINYLRNNDLFNQKAISLQDFDNIKLKYNVSKTQVESAQQRAQAAYFRIESAQANLKQANERLNRTSVFASMDGTITKLDVDIGQRVVGTGQMAGTEILKIADLTRMQVQVEINENDIVKLVLGDTASVEVDAYPNKKFRGIVSEIGYFSKGSSVLSGNNQSDQVTTYPVRVFIDPISYLNDPIMKTLPKTQSPFRPGMSAVVNIYTDKVENVLTIPIQAVTIDRNKGPITKNKQEIVYVFKDNKAVVTEVTSGISDDNHIEIKSGLEKNAVIISGPYTTLTKELTDGATVKQKPADESVDGKKKGKWNKK